MVTLTDEELLCLVGDQGPFSYPFVEAEPAETRDLLARCGLRTLAARELVIPTGEDSLGVTDELAHLLRDRAHAAVVALLEVDAGNEHVTRYLGLGPDLLIVEDVSALGLHRLERADPCALGRILEDGLAPLAHPAGQDPPPAWDDVLQEPRVTADLVVGTPRAPTHAQVMHSAIAVSQGLYVASALHGSGELPALRSSTFDELCREWSDLVLQALYPTGADPEGGAMPSVVR